MKFKCEWLLVGRNSLVVMVDVDQEGRGEKRVPMAIIMDGENLNDAVECILWT